jgi:hypothetical protein
MQCDQIFRGMRMAAFEQPRTGGQGYLSVLVDAPGTMTTTPVSSRAAKTTGRLQWAGSIVGGIAVGAAAAFLVAGFLGVHETTMGSVHVASSSVIEPSKP